MSGVPDPRRLDGLVELANRLRLERRFEDSIVLFEHLETLAPTHVEILRGLVESLGAQGRTLDALGKLVAMKTAGLGAEALLSMIRQQAVAAISRFNAHQQAGQVALAEPYAAALAALLPQSPPMLRAAMECNRALGRAAEAVRYARELLAIDPADPAALAVLSGPGAPAEHAASPDDELERQVARALTAGAEVHPLIRLRDLHDASSAILCRPLTARGQAQVEQLLCAARALAVDAPPGSEWEGWEKHYRLLLDAVDLAAVRAPTPPATPEPDTVFMGSTGERLDRDGLGAAADALQARCVFFAAADESYVKLYARWYALSVLKHCDVPFLIVIHVIGGKDRLPEIAAEVGVRDERLVYAADGFDAAAVAARCYDSPPKGLIDRPVAHYQCQRFLRLGALLEAVQRPVFVSDIDLLLQRGVEDLLQRCANADLALNENEVSLNAGSRLTANLLLANPTPNAAVFLRFLKHQLQKALSGAEVTRWIDQLGLLLARHHLLIHGRGAQIAYFDTQSDINNVMYRSYQDHPFRFLSLYHGFDTSSLEGNPKVAGAQAAAPRPARARKPRKRA